MKFLTILLFSITLALATVNINNATVKDFTSLKGIGDKTIAKNKSDLKLDKCVK